MNRKVEFAIITSPRTLSYLHVTVASMRETGLFENPSNLPVRLICGRRFKPNDHQLKPYRGDGNFSIEQSVEKGLPVGAIMSTRHSAGSQRDLCVNHRRAILNFSKSDSTHLCVFEDDVKFSRGWLPRLNEAIDEVDREYKGRWVMTLFARSSDEPISKMADGKKWYSYSKRPYVGTQGIVYPRAVALAMAPAILSRCVMVYEHPIDELLGHWADENNITLVASAPSLVQHVGDISTMGHGHMVTNGFVDEII